MTMIGKYGKIVNDYFTEITWHKYGETEKNHERNVSISSYWYNFNQNFHKI
jgi:hypothetical protein